MIRMSRDCRTLAAAIGRHALLAADVAGDDIDNETIELRRLIEQDISRQSSSVAELLAILAIECGFTATLESEGTILGHKVCRPFQYVPVASCN